MTDRATIDLKDLTPEQRKQIGIKAPRRPRSMTLHDVRSAAIRVLYVIHELTPVERGRVLRHAMKVNDV